MIASVGCKRRWKEIRDGSEQEDLMNDIVTQMAYLNSQGSAKSMNTNTGQALHTDLDDSSNTCVALLRKRPSSDVLDSRLCEVSKSALHQSAALDFSKKVRLC